MKKTKRPIHVPAAKRQRTSASASENNLPDDGALIASTSLLNKYNQKKPSGARKLSPAADEEME